MRLIRRTLLCFIILHATGHLPDISLRPCPGEAVDLKRLISDEQDFDRLRNDPDFEFLVGLAGAGDTPTAA